MNQVVRKVRRWWNRQLEEFFGPSWEERSTANKIAAGAIALTYLTTREVMRDRGPMMAAGLAFFTVLAIVPLMTVAVTLMTAFGVADGPGGEVFDLLYQVFPDVASGLAGYLGDIATDSAQAIGGIGAVTLLIICLVLFNYIEETLTEIWRGDHDRSYVVKMLTFWGMITLAPVLIALSIIQSARAQIFLSEMGLDVTFMARMAPLLYALAAFTLLNKLVPNAEVKWRAALVGGLFTAIAFELAKWGFNVYVNQLLMQTYDRVYGAVALIPIGLIWVYITWLVILIGAELSYAFQYMQELLRAESGRRSSEARPGQFHALHPMVPIEVLTRVLMAYRDGEGPISVASLRDETDFPAHLVDDVVDYLVDEGLIVAVGDEERRFVPSAPPASIDVETVIESFWVRRRRNQQPALERISEAYLEASRAFFHNYSGEDLVGDDEAGDSSTGDEDGQPGREAKEKGEREPDAAEALATSGS